MLKLADGNRVFGTYNIYLESGRKSTGSPMYLTFSLDAKYAGQDFTLVHKKADGSYEYFTAKTESNGSLTFGPLYELSPFMLVFGTLRAASAPATVSVVIPQTGAAPMQTGLLLAGAGLVLLLAAVGAEKRRRRG